MRVHRHFHILPLLILSVATQLPAAAQQRADINFTPEVEQPTWLYGTGPLVVIDEAHHNFHTLDGRYRAFALLLQADGYRVEAGTESFTPGSLDRIDILVIANAIAEENLESWDMPNPPAFTDQEVEVVREWVKGGGSLWLIADHMPCPAAAGNLAAAFGLLFINGYAIDPDDDAAMQFRPGNGTLVDHPILRGRGPVEEVPRVTSFTGQGFRVAPGTEAEPIMMLGEGVVIMLPEASWQFTGTTQQISGFGLLQGATVRYGRGRVAAFGEAAMFTSQTGGEGPPFGMAHPDAPHNRQFALNIAHWLSDLLSGIPAGR